jgi:hypothetical protein
MGKVAASCGGLLLWLRGLLLRLRGLLLRLRGLLLRLRGLLLRLRGQRSCRRERLRHRLLRPRSRGRERRSVPLRGIGA